MGEPTEKLYLDPTKKQDLTKAQGAMSLEYEPTMVGVDQCILLSMFARFLTVIWHLMATSSQQIFIMHSMENHPVSMSTFDNCTSLFEPHFEINV